MPISVEYLRNNLNSELSKGQAGYFSDEEFNDFLKSAQITAFEYYMNKKMKASKQVEDALSPFLKRETLSYTNGVSPFPTDYYHSDTMFYKWTQNTCNGLVEEDLPVPFITQSQYSGYISDYLRKPSIAKKRIYYSFINNKIEVYPKSITNTDFVYYRPPQEARYASNIIGTPNGDFEQFDAANSVDLEWNVAQQEDFMDLLLFFSGISLRESEIVSYAKMKQQENLIR
jgi:hypothetical protein